MNFALALVSEEQLKNFWEAVQTNISLQEKLRATSVQSFSDSIVSIAKEAGFEITAEEVKEAQAQLSDEQLRGAAGGACGCSTGSSAWNSGYCLAPLTECEAPSFNS